MDRSPDETVAQSASKSCALSFIADRQHRYPGEDVTFCVRVQVAEPIPGLTLTLFFPDRLLPGHTEAPDYAVPQLALDEAGRYLIWQIAGKAAGDEMGFGVHPADSPMHPTAGVYEYRVIARVALAEQDEILRSRAVVSWDGEDGTSEQVSQVALVAVSAKGRYLQYLPALYQRDELMGRFLMLFESFWSPVEGQIANLPFYFDPRMAPSDLLPWLASWIGLILDPRWPEDRCRLLIEKGVSLYRKRGTRQGLLDYLNLLGEDAEIIEHRANNFRLGSEGRLGPGVALGTQNVPLTFTVVLRLPVAQDVPEAARLEQEHRQIVQTIIEAEKPAHTHYTLRVEFAQPVNQMEG